MLFSIIVPVYNVEKYMEECLESILSQSFGDFEIIIVDDGSTDSSSQIADAIVRKDKRVKVIHRKNAGLSVARNTGLKNAKGDYALFVDSDDYIAENSLQALADTIFQSKTLPDVVFLEAFKVYPNAQIKPLKDNLEDFDYNEKSTEEFFECFSRMGKFPGSACTKAVKLLLIKDKGLFFRPDLLSEDLDWTARLLLRAGSFAYCEHPFYYYRQNRAGSITNTIGLKNVKSLLSIIGRYSIAETANLRQVAVNSFMAYEMGIVVFNYHKLSENDKLQIKPEIMRLLWVLKKSRKLTIKLFYYVCRTFGINNAANIASKIYYIKENRL